LCWGRGSVALARVLRGMQRAGAEGWTAVVCGCVDGEGQVCCCVPPATHNVAHVHAAHSSSHTSRLTRHASHVTPHTSHFTRRALHVTPHTSRLTRHASHCRLICYVLNCIAPNRGCLKNPSLLQVVLLATIHFQQYVLRTAARSNPFRIIFNVSTIPNTFPYCQGEVII
jgi:hypothetical protein